MHWLVRSAKLILSRKNSVFKTFEEHSYKKSRIQNVLFQRLLNLQDVLTVSCNSDFSRISTIVKIWCNTYLNKNNPVFKYAKYLGYMQIECRWFSSSSIAWFKHGPQSKEWFTQRSVVISKTFKCVFISIHITLCSISDTIYDPNVVFYGAANDQSDD